MKTSTKVRALLLAAALPAIPAQAALTHRYSFNEATGTVATDSVGGAAFNGTLVNGAILSGGKVVLGNSGTANDVTTGQYVDLPNNIAKTANVTVEGWATWNGGNQWSRIFDFGNNTGGEEIPGSATSGYTGTEYFFASPRQGNDTGNGRNDNYGSEFLQGGSVYASDLPLAANDFNRGLAPAEHHFALSITGGAGGNMTLYRDGVLTATVASSKDPSILNELNDWIGRSNWQGDPFFNGSVNEFRIFDTALTAGQIAGDFAAGPNTVPEPSSVAALSLATLALLKRRGLRR